MEELDVSYNTSTSQQQGATESALRLRLSMNELIENMELFLRGAIIKVYENSDGEIKQKKEIRGRPKANDDGIQALLNWAQLVLNPSIVQGNFPIDNAGYSQLYEEYIYHMRLDLTTNILVNCYYWNIRDEEIMMIIDSMMNAIEPFMTRLIDNQERESYGQSLKSVETRSDNTQGGIRLFGS